ncbi:antirestriction protein ArdR [Salmonella enterica]|nr:antirestriction protein ArdR [Salmonella enterica]EAM8769989.1 antirestriction protein ArdR [Salmonella enterica]EAP0380303.1 antirestriction protein ArdR [Salmonella enterica]EBQ7680629.1 antirestriction protein ArdR [Salmonella enterica]
MMNYVDIARVWRQHNQEHADSGVVLIWDGKVYCWKNILRDPQHERPGVIAVDTEENVFIAEGGNEYDGAKCWVVFQES